MLFNESIYSECNDIPDIVEFYWPNPTKWQVRAVLSILGNTATSLPKAPYAGFEIQNHPSLENLNEAIDSLFELLKKNHISSLSMNQSPQILMNNYKQLHDLLIRRGFEVREEVNHHVELDNWQSNISPMQMRRVKKAQKEGLMFSGLQNFTIDEVYLFIDQCRTQQGLKVNIDHLKFKKLLSRLPEYYSIHLVSGLNQNLMACLVTIQVSPTAVYSFLPAFDRTYSQLSPLAFLFYKYFEKLTNTSIRFVDLGISSIHGQPQAGLIKFKEGMGGIFSPRYSYHIKW